MTEAHGEPKNEAPFTTPAASKPLEAEVVPPPTTGGGVNHPPSVFSGRGLFTAWDASSANNRNADWVAIQLDEEGDGSFDPTDETVMGWAARPAQVMVDKCREMGNPFIAQAENEEQLKVALQLDTHGVSKALVGNPGSWSDASFHEASVQGWELLLEWYWNAQPSYTSPDAHGYPLFVGCVFGCYDAAGEQPGGRRVSLSEYKKIWPGPFSVYLAETMTEEDWEVF